MAKHTKPRTHRGGKYKCKRCREVYIKEAGVKDTICPRCRVHCSRCDILLTPETHDKTSAKRGTFWCKKCTSERAGATRDKLSQRDWQLTRNYGITVNEYEVLLNAKNENCWICGNPKPPNGKRLAVDHKHEKGEKRRNPREKRARVRGLLCWQCNGAIGKFKDNPALMRKAADYIESNLAQQLLNKETQ